MQTMRTPRTTFLRLARMRERATTPTPKSERVWVNTDTNVYHSEGDRFYEKMKHGKYMTESEAIQGGYRAAKK